jgi:hypothetical protein
MAVCRALMAAFNMARPFSEKRNFDQKALRTGSTGSQSHFLLESR